MPTSTTAIAVQTVATATNNADIQCVVTQTATGSIVDWYINEVATGVDRLLVKEVKRLIVDSGQVKIGTIYYYYNSTAVNYTSSTVPAANTNTGNAFKASKETVSDSVDAAAVIKAITG